MTGSNGIIKTYGLGVLLLVLLLPACGGSEPTATFFGVEVPPGWSPSGETEVLHRENLFDLVNGQADAFFAYGFEQVSLQQYEDAAGAVLTVEVWQGGVLAGQDDVDETGRYSISDLVAGEYVWKVIDLDGNLMTSRNIEVLGYQPT